MPQKTLQQNTYKTCSECHQRHYHQMRVLTDMEKVIDGNLPGYTREFTCHGCGETYLEYRSVKEDKNANQTP